MTIAKKKVQACLVASLCLLLVLTGCTGSPTPTLSPTAPILIVTQVVTQIATATTAPSATPAPTSTPVPTLTSTPTYDPFSAPIYYPLEDCVASRLHVGDIAMVSLTAKPNGIRYGQDLFQDTIAEYADPGALLDIVGAPGAAMAGLSGWCARKAASSDIHRKGTGRVLAFADRPTIWLIDDIGICDIKIVQSDLNFWVAAKRSWAPV